LLTWDFLASLIVGVSRQYEAFILLTAADDFINMTKLTIEEEMDFFDTLGPLV
jgi:hypothetical protein